MIIRAESPADYPAIHDLQMRAFENKFGVATLVALLRTMKTYTPDLALVAEKKGRVVGHIMFTPIEVYLNREIIKIVNLSPLGVHPDFQNQGIGGALVTEGHQIVRDKGYDASILLGHPTYYPRFGYQTKAYGASSVTVKTDTLSEIALETANPLPDDLPILAQLHQANEQAVNLSIVPETTFAEWLSPHPNIACTVYRYQGEIVGYTRGTNDNVIQFLARDDEMARAMAKHLAGDAVELTLPLHPNSSCASAFDEQPTVSAWEAGMICPLRDDSSMWDYLKDIEADGLVGRIIWSSAFDIA